MRASSKRSVLGTMVFKRARYRNRETDVDASEVKFGLFENGSTCTRTERGYRANDAALSGLINTE